MAEENNDVIILEENIAEDYEPSAAEITEYALWLSIDPVNEAYLLPIAREGLLAPLPPDWKPCMQGPQGVVYYFNFSSGESTWDHPCDTFYRTEVDRARRVHAAEAEATLRRVQEE